MAWLAPRFMPAQQPRDSARIVIRGVVRDASTSEPVANVVVHVAEAIVGTTTQSGEFTVEAPPASHLTLHFRRIGYDSLSVELEVSSAVAKPYVFELHRVAQTLDTVAVATQPTTFSPKVAGFEARLARHIGGTFFAREEIERRQPLVASDLVRRAQGVRVVDSMGVRLFASARGPKVVHGKRGLESAPCIMRVGVDGRIMEWGFAADQITPNDIYGIEVYSGPATIPREFATQVTDAFCGLVMIWTR